MRYQSVEQIRAHAEVAWAHPPMTREERLLRWAKLLARHGSRPLEALRWVEFYAEPERRRLRRDGSPISVAFSDPTLRNAGLAGDTLGDAQTFFGLSDDEAHRLLCDCHYQGRMTGRSTAHGVRTVARPGFFGRLVAAFG
jgi:hypothetical protein